MTANYNELANIHLEALREAWERKCYTKSSMTCMGFLLLFLALCENF